MTKPIPYVCPACPLDMVDTEDGQARGYYGVLVKDGKPMVGNGAVRPLTCPNCETGLVPAVASTQQQVSTNTRLAETQ